MGMLLRRRNYNTEPDRPIRDRRKEYAEEQTEAVSVKDVKQAPVRRTRKPNRG